ncbi:alpha-amylase/4-alpha-glucanotransferase domain-containing protein [Quisquiliibacterium transsilvanicum]|uniref:Alpha-amylase n=1 Tax=Quisquiliibacterium transsilvanicum TaxID=1549638 RepID=A0A7W8HDY1_9BURK|nr:alpha-amylase/4-alpha-glucanotransferase domain-containing protein [Quisquiliibacterium transsilvanicum]MBB5270181.1 alpha-amylase [Quisquiliibacterium transsilvanicum]
MTSSEPLQFLFGVHAHQPVGNFPSVIDDAVERCYRPFLETLSRYPGFRFALHLSGWLLGDLAARHPALVEQIAQMVSRGQLELFGAGDCEPVLAAIPERDRISQLEAMNARLERHFGLRPAGAWLTERVWESSVVPSLVRSGVRYVLVDDYHFLCAGVPADALDRHFATEEDGLRLDVFPISEALRYRLPFAPAADALGHLESLAAQGHAAAIHFDDLEKFGIWPETHEWVYGRGWLAAFVEAVLASPTVRAESFSAFHAGRRARGLVYLPTTSYIEMNEWTLPPAAARRFAELQQRERAAGSFEESKAFVRGGIWRNFLSRYPESNWLHKRMLRASARLDAQGAAAALLRPLLHEAQSNDAYWHGLFGGLYLPHLRRAAWSSLCALEAGLERLSPRAPLERVDLDLDGRDEWLIGAGGLQAALRDDGRAALHELSSLPLLHNFGDTLARREEAYHERIGAGSGQTAQGEGIASAHDRIASKHAIEPEDLEPDLAPRAICVDRIVDPQGAAAPLDGYRIIEEGAGVGEGAGAGAPSLLFETALDGARVAKRIAVGGDGVRIEWRCQGLAGRRLVTQLNLAMPSCDGYGGRYVLADGSIPAGFGQPLAIEAMELLTLDDRALDGALRLECRPACRMAGAPLHTVSLSEGGFEKIMQAAVVELTFELKSDYETVRLAMLPSR